MRRHSERNFQNVKIFKIWGKKRAEKRAKEIISNSQHCRASASRLQIPSLRSAIFCPSFPKPEAEVRRFWVTLPPALSGRRRTSLFALRQAAVPDCPVPSASISPGNVDYRIIEDQNQQEDQQGVNFDENSAYLCLARQHCIVNVEERFFDRLAATKSPSIAQQQDLKIVQETVIFSIETLLSNKTRKWFKKPSFSRSKHKKKFFLKKSLKFGTHLAHICW